MKRLIRIYPFDKKARICILDFIRRFYYAIRLPPQISCTFESKPRTSRHFARDMSEQGETNLEGNDATVQFHSDCIVRVPSQSNEGSGDTEPAGQSVDQNDQSDGSPQGNEGGN